MGGEGRGDVEVTHLVLRLDVEQLHLVEGVPHRVLVVGGHHHPHLLEGGRLDGSCGRRTNRAMAVPVFTWLHNFLLPTRVFRGCQSFCIFYSDYFCDADNFCNRVYFVKAVTGFESQFPVAVIL